MADFLLELLCEEIPARMQAKASEGFIAGCMSERYISVVTRAMP